MYDYLTKIDVNCPVDESEEKRRLNVHKPAADKAEDGYVVFGMNEVYLDVCNASYQQFVRFNRKNRMVYAFRHNGAGGVVAVPWDKAFFFPHRQTSVAIFGGARTVMRCYVMADDGKTIKDTFSFGVRVVNGDDETDEWGKKVLGEVLANFEFIRRFMENGPEHLRVDRYMPKGPSLKASFSIWFDGFREVGSVAKVLVTFVALPAALLATLHYIAQLTSREPVWPDDVQRASASDETSATVIV
ncbi:DUF6708 domain-containing protein [Paraburkholderia guartelaensis]|uniref:DUF6708 domain-containing protein n=1 Tax=Paraburkholderia guartelaensis TaxID=2546446 RepID=UPI002AB63D6E|nr:DUF6708 domain-containing protein [Paraburkholderia guartelaensis]